MNEVCDEERFAKVVSSALEEVRNGTHDGLFTAYGPEEKNWGTRRLFIDNNLAQVYRNCPSGTAACAWPVEHSEYV
ncbi:uncharacterized protein EI97DRAFT_436797 [Westerdykella ornata]|uniref:Uncharacterized protein n=1 Tax=Westerdykella ornata TaxID=318751 RepID=A0A6A6J7K1_WESOR|nr:uncharacterized protein EI97DRAFT_436797 [Westerdykella ornata]KAF2272550.1 hypothetical protein EI97DRAFT_436797 [Westerdykella ornata]